MAKNVKLKNLTILSVTGETELWELSYTAGGDAN